ncbi:MAG TPA: DMT family transporter [Chroococcidiopsis sp.]
MTDSPSAIRPPTARQIGGVMTIGILAVSSAAIFIRLAIAAAGGSGVGFSLFLSAARLTVASVVLLPVWRNMQISRQRPAAVLYAIAAGLALAVHFATWISSLSFTSIAASATLVTTNPIWVALISWLWFAEKPSRLTALGIAVAFGGGTMIALGDGGLSAGSNPLLGNGLALIGAVMSSLYFLLGREAQRNGISIGRYAAIAYGTGAIALLPLPALAGINYLGYPAGVYLYTLLMAVTSQVVGHTALNWSVRWISPTVVALALLFEPVGASALAYFVFAEVPGVLVLVGAVTVLSGVAIAVLGDWKKS